MSFSFGTENKSVHVEADIQDKKLAKPIPIPAFSDIAKQANDLLNKDFYHTAAANLEVKSKAPNGVNFTVKGKSAHDGPLTGALEAKKQDKPNGLTGTLGWNTANSIDARLELDETIAKDVKVEVLSSLIPEKGNPSIKGNFYIKPSPVHIRGFLDVMKGPTATIDAVAGSQGFLAGAEAGYDVQKAALTKWSIATGYQAPQYSCAVTATNNVSTFTASYFHKVNDQTQAGAKASYDNKNPGTVGLEVATKYQVDPMSFVKGKVDNKGVAAVSYNTKVREGFTLGLGASFDTQKLNEATHKVGAHFAFES